MNRFGGKTILILGLMLLSVSCISPVTPGRTHSETPSPNTHPIGVATLQFGATVAPSATPLGPEPTATYVPKPSPPMMPTLLPNITPGEGPTPTPSPSLVPKAAPTAVPILAQEPALTEVPVTTPAGTPLPPLDPTTAPTSTYTPLPPLVPTAGTTPTQPQMHELQRRLYQGKDLSGWEVVVGDGLYVQEGEHPVDLYDIETEHFGDYSELRANVKGRAIMAHNLTFKRIRDSDAFNYHYKVKFEFRLPYEPVKGDREFNPQTIEGSLQVWDGANTRIDYVIGFQWSLNPWDDRYGTINMWFGGTRKWEKVGFLEPDTSWHTFEGYLDFEKSRTWISIDDMKYESELLGTSRKGLGWGRDVSARLGAEIINLFPGETGAGAKHKAYFRNWS